MSMGILCEAECTPRQRWLRRGAEALRALALYAALWVCLTRMAGLGGAGTVPLCLGGALCAALTLTPGRSKAKYAAAGAGLGLFLLLLLLFRGSALDGTKLLLNRLFAASEGRQAYTYQMFDTTPGAGTGEVRRALLPLGLVAGAACAFGTGRGVLFALFALVAAWLGVTPGSVRLILLSAALVFSLMPLPKRGWKGMTLAALSCALALGVICAGAVLAFPGESAALSAWEERARDALASDTVAYLDAWEPPDAPEETPPPEDKEETPPPEEQDRTLDLSLLLTRRSFWPALLAILLLALALFVPSVWRDRLQKKRAVSRAGLDDPDPAAAVRAALPYALRWLALGGLTPRNVPLGEYAEEIGERFSPALQAEFNAVLPLWQEAAYSDHPMSEAQRVMARSFTEHAKAAARERMGNRQKFLAAFVYGL